jgi:plasmid stability protein
VANLIIELPDDLARSLQGIAAANHKSLQQLAIEGLRSLVHDTSGYPSGSAAAVLRAAQEAPHPTASDMDEFDAILAGSRLSVQSPELFRE